MTNMDMRYVVAVDGQQADAELARLHKEATTLAGAEDKLAASTTKATTAVVAQGNAAVTTTAKTETLQQRVSKWPDLLGKQAAAISLVSSSLADQNGWVGKAVAGAGQMAAAYGAGGPFALALVGGLALVSQFTSHLERLNAEQQRDIDLKYATIDALATERTALQKRVADLRRQADPEGTKKLDREAAVAAADKLDAEIRGLKVAAIQYGVSKERQTQMIAEAGIKRDELALLREEIDLRDKIAAKDKGDAGKPAAVATKAKAKALDLGDLYGDSPENLRAFVDRETARDEILQEGIDLTKAREKEKFETLLKMEQDAEAERLRIAERSAQERETLRIAEVSAMQGYANTAVGIAASASTQLISDLVGQQEHALERFGIAVMAQAGQALVSYGAQAIGRGILELSSPVTAPLAAASFTAGGVLLGAGIGLGGTAGGLGALLGGGGGASAPSERGVSSGFSGGATGGGGGTNITIVYGGASGPTADHAARAVSDSVARAGARNLSRDEVR